MPNIICIIKYACDFENAITQVRLRNQVCNIQSIDNSIPQFIKIATVKSSQIKTIRSVAATYTTTTRSCEDIFMLYETCKEIFKDGRWFAF